MCWFYMGIAQIAWDPSALCRTGKRGKKVPQTILAMPIWKQHVSKRGFPRGEFLIICLRTSKTKQGEVQRRSSSVWPGPKSRWSTACSSSSFHREFCIQPLDKVEKIERLCRKSQRVWTWTNLAFLPQMMHSPFVSCVLKATYQFIWVSFRGGIIWLLHWKS